MKYTTKHENGLDRLHKPVKKEVYNSYISKKIGNKFIYRYSEEDRKQYWDNKNENQIRMEIHGIIHSGIFSGKPILDIIQEINSDERFIKFSEYFEIWINQEKDKKEEIISRIKKELESGKSKEEILNMLYKFTKWVKHKKYFEELVDLTINEIEKEEELEI